MGDVLQYKIFCETEGTWKGWLLDEDDAVPTTCPTDTAHTVSAGSAKVISWIDRKPKQREDGVEYAVPKAGSFGYELCDRDFKLCIGQMDAKAMHTVVNGANGSVTYVAARSGEHANGHTIEVTVGATGAGNEDRDLACVRTGTAFVVTFGTDGSGDTVTPTALEVATLINSDYSLAISYLNAQPSGDGSGDALVVAETALAGGTSPSHEDLRINTTTLLEEGWGEISQVGVYKLDGGAMVPCDDQADADANATLTVWEYIGVNPYTNDLCDYEIRDGYMVVDPTLPVEEFWDHRAYAVGAPLIPGNLGGTIRMFDGYFGPAPNGVIDAKNSQAIHLSPDTAPGASVFRLYVYHAAASALCHVLRLVTYRAQGTF